MASTYLILRCQHCGDRFIRKRAEVRYRCRNGIKNAFCSRACTGARRRVNRTVEEKKALKAAYDVEYRAKNLARILRQKRDHHRRTYDPVRARAARRKRARWHVEYCRRYYADPKRKAKKVAYDLDRRAAAYGEYAGAYKAALKLKREVLRRCPDRYERQKGRGYFHRVNALNRERRRHGKA